VRRGNREVCFAVDPGGFDLWLNGDMHKHGVAESEAVSFLTSQGN
jgi:hypothetical protein